MHSEGSLDGDKSGYKPKSITENYESNAKEINTNAKVKGPEARLMLWWQS